MKRLVYALLLVFFAASCGKNGWYINVDNTAWEISTDTQVGWPCFLDDVNVSIIQKNKDNSHFSTLNGTFTVDGHRVDVSADGGSIRMIRTFSHLKNSSNRNYKSLSPLAPAPLGGSIWACMKDTDFIFYHFLDDGSCRKGVFKNAPHKEGIPYGWEISSPAYTVDGSHFSSADDKGSFFGNSFLKLETMAVPFVSAPGSTEGSSSLKGTLWNYRTNSYPGFILFTSATEFTRILVSSPTAFDVLTGTYRIKGNSVEFITEATELCRTCPISNGQFTYLEKSYSIMLF